MKIKNIYGKLIWGALFFMLVSCKKYEEGPVVSLKSKTERLANTWKVEKAMENGENKLSEYNNIRITLTREGYYFYYTVGLASFSFSFTGSWKLVNDNKVMEAEVKDGAGVPIIKRYKIIRLKENEVWLIDLDNMRELRLIPA
jgi:hypothetical protein